MELTQIPPPPPIRSKFAKLLGENGRAGIVRTACGLVRHPFALSNWKDLVYAILGMVPSEIPTI